MGSAIPRVSIGMPVFDGERFLGEAIESLLAQDFEDFELIVSDNASTDRTPEICMEFAAADRRVRYLRNEENLGAAYNYNRLVSEARGTYFKWAPHDDLHAPGYLRRCVEVLDRDPGVALCHSFSAEIDEDGEVLRYWEPLPARGDADPVTRFLAVITRPDQCVDVVGLARRDVLAKTSLIGSYSSSDVGLLAEIALHGRIHHVPETMFYRREHRDRSTRQYATDRERGAWFDPELEGAVVFPLWRLGRAFVAGTHRAPLPTVVRLHVYTQLGPWAWRWRDRLAREAAWGLREHARRAPSRVRNGTARALPPGAEPAAVHPPVRPPPTTEVELVSVVVPMRDSEATIADQLEALANQDYKGDFEVVVADNGSTDGGPDIVRAFVARLPDLRLVDASARRGAAHARNVGTTAGRGDLILYTDADDVVAPGWVTAMVAAAGEAWLLAGVDTQPVSNGDGSEPVASKAPQAAFLPWARGGNMGVRREAFEAVGGWDEQRLRGQDVDFSWRVQLAGYGLRRVPQAMAWYRRPEGLRALARHQFAFGARAPSLYRDFEQYGARRRRLLTARQLAWLGTRLPYLAMSGERRRRWVRTASGMVGRCWGTVLCWTAKPRTRS